MYEITCGICARAFRAAHSRRRYCGEACRLKARRERNRVFARTSYRQYREQNPLEALPPAPCDSCGKSFTPKRSNHRYCSDICKTAGSHARAKSKFHATGTHLKSCSSCGSTTATPTWTPGIGVCDDCRVDQRDRVKARAKERRRRLRKYGLDEQSYQELLDAQGGRCAICSATEPGSVKDWAIDHHHATRQVRGLLCHHCNMGIGQLGDDPARLRAAADYLEAHAPTLERVA